jgi:hypothetical protein
MQRLKLEGFSMLEMEMTEENRILGLLQEWWTRMLLLSDGMSMDGSRGSCTRWRSAEEALLLLLLMMI